MKNNPPSVASDPSHTFALVIVKSDASQSLLQSLLSLEGLAASVGTVFVLHATGCEPNHDESVQLSRIGVRTHLREIELARLNEALNAVFEGVQPTAFVCLKAGDQLPAGFFNAISSCLARHIGGGLFYPTAQEVGASQTPTRVFGNLSAEQTIASSSLQVPCAFSGLTIRRSHFMTMGGFHTGCQVVGELDFWLRTYLTFPKALVQVPGVKVQVQSPSVSYLLKFGARQVLEWCTLVHRFAGSCSAKSFIEYADQLKTVSAQRPDLNNTLHEHLCDMANRLLPMIEPVERGMLQPWLQNSFAIQSQRSELQAIDQVLLSEFKADLAILPNLYNGGFSIHSVGSFCHAAQVLKDLGLRHRPGPFDWIFCNAAAAAHMLTDRFRVFLDASNFREVPDEEKVDRTSNLCSHSFYEENFGVKFMFNNHRPFQQKDGDLFRKAVNSIESDLDSHQPCILFHVARMNGPPENFLNLWRSVQSREAPKRLVVVRFVEVSEERYLVAPISLIRHLDSSVLEFQLPVVSKTNGTRFLDVRDNRRLRRLLYSYTQIALSEIGVGRG